ncbi:YkgJ family cysteine cluster protein [Stenotrophomonas maltophilia]|nr:YkgJ family cysteine cluster protein [Stenotrophomonas maltophilia]PZP86555.1 MAG: zinc/iron-chelating domain-containing protein [Stenotrophomonas maltophilia]
MNAPFPCSGCGLCCQQVHVAEQTRYLDRGDGVCRHYCEEQRRCGIYEDRPDICRVDLQFQRHYAATVSWDAFVEINVQACRFLQAQPSPRSDQRSS